MLVTCYVTMKNTVFHPSQPIFPLFQFYFARNCEQNFVGIIPNFQFYNVCYSKPRQGRKEHRQVVERSGTPA